MSGVQGPQWSFTNKKLTDFLFPVFFFMIFSLCLLNNALFNDFVNISAHISSVSMYCISISFSLTFSLNILNSIWKCLERLWFLPPCVKLIAPLLSWYIIGGIFCVLLSISP